jgi:thiol-disulfide isomerase/thioredoxin
MKLGVVRLVAFWVAFSVLATSALAQSAELTDPKPLPALPMETLGGTPVELSQYDGQVVVLNLFATWCAPCKAEMPALDRLQAKLDDSMYKVIALAVDRAGPEKIQKWMDDVGVVHLTTLRDPSASATRITGVPGLPTTFIIDAQGRERARVFGVEEWDSEEVVRMLEALLEETS